MYRIIQRQDIDTAAWDRCVDASPNAALFGRSAFLDFAANRWRGLVRGDYTGVFPLVESSKFGIPYLYRPPGLARIDLYSPHSISETELSEVLKTIRKSYLLADILLAGKLATQDTPPKTKITPFLSQYLTIETDDFESLFQKSFNASSRNLIRKAAKNGLVATRQNDVAKYMEMAKTSVAAGKIHKFQRQLPAMERFANGALKSGLGQIWFVEGPDGTLSAALITARDGVTYLNFIFANEAGQKANANYLLVSEIIRAHFPRIRGFDFCGSNIDSIGQFNKRFGAEDREHTAIRMGRLARITA